MLSKAVIFDIDSLFKDVDTLIRNTAASTLNEYFVVDQAMISNAKSYKNILKLMDELNLQASPLRQKTILKYYQDILFSNVRELVLKDEAIKLLDGIKENYDSVLISRFDGTFVYQALEAHSLGEKFSDIFVKEDFYAGTSAIEIAKELVADAQKDLVFIKESNDPTFTLRQVEYSKLLSTKLENLFVES